MPCSQMSSEAPQNILTQQYHGIHHLSNAGDGELLGGSVLLCAQERFTHHMVILVRDQVCSLLLHSCTDFGERTAASSKPVLPLCSKQGYVGMGFQTAGSSQWSCKELGEESGLLPSYSGLTKGKRKGVNLFSPPRNLKIRGCFRVSLLALHIICSLCSGWSC